MIKEFKEFILKGNMIDMAVGIIIGAAFGTVVKSLVSNVVMPPVGQLLGGIDFSKMKMVLQDGKEAVMEGEKEVTAAVEEVAINYGIFINDIITLIIVGLVVFIGVKIYNNLQKQEEEAPSAPPEPSNEEKLLTEIRDLLAK